jgi:uroporphyrinogen III methyltransferase/synthase
LVSQQFVSEAFARELIAIAPAPQRILLVRALEGRDVLATMLRNAGLDVTMVPAYQTVIADDAQFLAKVRTADTVTFTSASTVRGFCTLLQDGAAGAISGKCVACIGPVTADAARRFGLHVDVVAAAHTVGGLIDALRAHYGAMQ